MTDKQAIMAANAAFYAALCAGDGAKVAQIWADTDDISCIHPGWPVVIGRAAVIGSWRDILSGSGMLEIACHEPHAIVNGDEGRVLCIEIVGSAALAASNHFRRIDGVWRLIHHQASAIAQMIHEPTPTPDAPSRQVH